MLAGYVLPVLPRVTSMSLTLRVIVGCYGG